MSAPFVIFNPISGDSISTFKGPSDVIDIINPSSASKAPNGLSVLITSAIADMVCGYIVSCEIYDFRDGMTAIGLVTPHMEGAEYMTPLSSVTLGIYQDSVKCFYRAPSEHAVRLTMALMELQDATRH